MARSLLTLAAAASAALPEVGIEGVRQLTTGTSGRYDAALVTIASGEELVARVPTTTDALSDVESELIALRALTAGAREVMGFDAPELRGTAPFDDTRVVVTTYLRGYHVEAAHIPAGRGVADAIGRAIGRVHDLPQSVVRGAGLPVRSPADARADLERLLDAVGRSGRVPVRLMVRWREAVEDDRLWDYDSRVVLGGTQSTSFVLRDAPDGSPQVAGVLDWQGLSIGDPALDLHWSAGAPDAVEDIFASYADASVRAPDRALRVRARLHAELEFARWLVHGLEAHRPDIVDDAAELMDSLSAGLAGDALLADLPRQDRGDMSEAIAILDRVPRDMRTSADTSMHTDAFDPNDLMLHTDETWDAAPPPHARTEASTESIDVTQPVDAVAQGDDSMEPLDITQPVDLRPDQP